MLKYIISNITIDDISDKNEAERIIKLFLNDSINLIDYYYDDKDKRCNFAILGNKDQVLRAIQKAIKLKFSSNNYDKIQPQPKLKTLSFSPLRMDKIEELNVYVKEYLDEFVKITKKGIIPLGYLTPSVFPPYLSFYSNLQDEDFKKYLTENNSFITHGIKFVEKKDDIIFVVTRSYPVVLYLKIAINEVSVIEKLVKKLKQFGKVDFIELNNKKEKYSLLSTAHTYSVPNGTAVIAVKINDYIKIPVHKVMIYIYDILEKNGCIPYDAEFGFPIPSEVIKITSEDLFFDKESPAELSKEIKKVFTLFRFDIDCLFGYPSMLLEKKYSINDI